MLGRGAEVKDRRPLDGNLGGDVLIFEQLMSETDLPCCGLLAVALPLHCCDNRFGGDPQLLEEKLARSGGSKTIDPDRNSTTNPLMPPHRHSGLDGDPHVDGPG
jgi:hypothetical protein